MLETIREYAQRELEREGEADAAVTRYSAFFADLADLLEQGMRVLGRHQPAIGAVEERESEQALGVSEHFRN